MLYREFNPGPAASNFIHCYWVLEDGAPATSAQTIIPDGRSELIIALGVPFEQEHKGGWQLQPEIFLVGQLTGPFLIRPAGPARTIGVRFRPEGASRLLGLPMFELNDSAVALEDLSPALHRRLDRLRELPALADQLSALEQMLLHGLHDVDEDRLISAAVNEFERTHGLMGVSRVADLLGLSSRQFERRFRSAVGISPKLFSRMKRFQKVLQTIEDPNAKWVDTAIDCGYYDQAHLIRDFREFAGSTPTSLLNQEFDLARKFI
jgi:AraC-like DNA-binding protein